MKNEKLLQAIGKIDDDLVYGAVNHTNVKKKKHTWAKWGAMAACLCLAVCLGGFAALGLTDRLPSADKSDIPVEGNYYANEGTYSETDEYDIFGSFEIKSDAAEKSNVYISDELILTKGKSKTWTIDIDGDSSESKQDTFTVCITNNGIEEYLYICEDVTERRELANFSSNKDIERVLSNLNPDHRYEITIINLSVAELSIDVNIRSYQSNSGNIIH